ncbi:MAG TPA: glycosyltransferase family 2 protein [Saprospiraceae bacterium]|nr:glycosyltransferase family 2 protein [Saprospiraceae bacterium]HMQ81266.1 glycosyltransferase family 2 protein [Saprospiraceae bacterium]
MPNFNKNIQANLITTAGVALSQEQLLLPKTTNAVKAGSLSYPPKPWLYLSIFAFWIAALIWFQPRLWGLLEIAYSPASRLALLAFIFFIDFAWLYGTYNVCVVLFALIYKYSSRRPEKALAQASLTKFPPIAILYTTYNDFVEESVLSCVHQDYPDFTVYILDDSTDAYYQNLVDDFARQNSDRVVVVRRPDRKAFKAGNMNHALSRVATEEPYFAIADADEILPPDFLSKLVPVIEADPQCGFVQANHRANPQADSSLAQDLGIGIDIHWKWYQPLRNDYGFVMFLGHGALLRRKCWEEIGGFPDIVSEDLGFAIQIRERGYRGRFVEDVICFEDFPDSVRAFRIRHMKWTRGTSEFLKKQMGWLLKAKNITWTEKLDILFPTLNLPLTLVYFMFMVNANLILPYFFGHWQDMTFELGGTSIIFPIMVMHPHFQTIYTPDFFAITMMTFFAPVLCFILALATRPLRLFRFLANSTVLYAALAPLSSIGVLTYLISGKAIFLVTGDKKQVEHKSGLAKSGLAATIKHHWQQLIHKSHPDTAPVQFFEIATGLVFGVVCIYAFQISFLGLCLAFLLLPLLHHAGWRNPWINALTYLPFALILLGVVMAGLSLVGMQSVFFGYGFHF